MTHLSTLTAVQTLDRPDLWGIGHYRVGSQVVEWDIRFADIERNTDWAAAILQGYGIGRGSVVLAMGNLGPDAPHLGPFQSAVLRRGGTLCHADVFGWDARRSDMFARRLVPSMVVGLNNDVWQALVAADMTAAIGKVPHLLVRPDALVAVREAGLQPAVFAPLGPATAVSRAGQERPVVNPASFTVTERDGELRVSDTDASRNRFETVPTGVRGSVAPDGSLRLA